MATREGPICVARATAHRTGLCSIAVGLLVALATAGSPAIAWSQPPVSERDDDRIRVGPVAVSAKGRDRVRGGRPDGASIHIAWAPKVDDPDRDDRETLAAFERATFPVGAHRTIIDEPPVAWMRKLEKPSIPVRWNRKTVEYLQYWKSDPKGQKMMRAWMKRAGRYEARMREILREVDVPEDLVMVVLAESGFNPRVRSKVGAAGPWQFMEGTGAVYGLRRSYWVDERFDVEKSTYAAALYLKDLHVRFGSWELALAAYNAGYGSVMTAIERHNTNNYWALCEIESGLPYATTFYSPKIVAAAIVAKNRKAFGVDAKTIEARPRIDVVQVRVPQSTSLSALAKAIDTDAALLEELNAELVRGRTPPQRGSYTVKIPREKKHAFVAAGERLRKAWQAESTYVVRHGETLATIARKHGLSERELRALNGVQDAAEITGGLMLVVPREPVVTAELASTKEPEPPPLAAVIPVEPGKGQRRVFFVVTRSSTPKEIEKAFDVKWRDVVRWNDLDPHARLQPDQVLQLLVDAEFDPPARGVLVYEQNEVEYVARGSTAHIEAALRRRGLVRRAYKARKGDTLARIGRKFDLTVGDLARINAISGAREPEIGETIVVYVDEEKARGTVDAPPTRGSAKEKSKRPPSTPETAKVPGEAKRSEASPKPDARTPSKPDTASVPRGSPRPSGAEGSPRPSGPEGSPRPSAAEGASR
jgi:membrane-bound lytic murein transglycosylase D